MMGRKRLVPGAVAVYLMNEGSGTVLRDYSGNGNDGTLGAGAAAPTWGPTGLSFDGGDGVICAGVLYQSAALSAFAVVKVDAADLLTILGKYDPGAGKRCWHLSTGAGSPSRFSTTFSDDGTLAAGHGLQYLSSLSVCGDGKYHHLCFTFNAGTVVLYVDGIADTGATITAYNAPITSIYNPTLSTTIGSRLNNGAIAGGITGTIAATGTLPFALSAGQVAQNHAALKSMLTPRGVALA